MPARPVLPDAAPPAPTEPPAVADWTEPDVVALPTEPPAVAPDTDTAPPAPADLVEPAPPLPEEEAGELMLSIVGWASSTDTVLLCPLLLPVRLAAWLCPVVPALGSEAVCEWVDDVCR